MPLKTLAECQHFLGEISQLLTVAGTSETFGSQLDSAFSRLDCLENLTIRRINFLANDNSIPEGKIEEWFSFLSEIEKVHSLFAKKLWETSHQVWIKDAREVYPTKTCGYKYLEPFDEDDILAKRHEATSLWKSAMVVFYIREAKGVDGCYLIHSLVLKLLSRPVGRDLVKQFVKTSALKSVNVQLTGEASMVQSTDSSSAFTDIKTGMKKLSPALTLVMPLRQKDRLFNLGKSSVGSSPLPCVYWSPPHIVLAHEMQHLIDYQRYSHMPQHIYKIDSERWGDPLEYNAIFWNDASEIAIASLDYGFPMRVCYPGYNLRDARAVIRQKLAMDYASTLKDFNRRLPMSI